jgi:hypothetical protein
MTGSRTTKAGSRAGLAREATEPPRFESEKNLLEVSGLGGQRRG